MAEASATEVISTLLSQHWTIIVMAIQFILGLALGYISAKVLKYILAFICILALGAFLSVWSLGMTPAEVMEKFKLSIEAAKGLATVLGLMTVGPVAIGFIIGALIGLMKK